MIPADPLDPALLDHSDVRAALAARDVGEVYRLLGKAGVGQRRIAELTQQSQSEVSAIVAGRRVRDIEVLERIADGLGVPRAWMRLGYGEDEPAASSAQQDEDGKMKRRALIAATTGAALGQVVVGLGELTEVALPRGGELLPSRLGMAHVHTVQAVTERLRGVAREFGGQADLFGAAVEHFTRWMQVSAPEVVKARLAAALAELYTEAGWCCHDSGLDGTGHFTRAVRLADAAGDAYGVANAAWHAGVTLIHDGGHLNDALKLFQLGQIRLGGFQPGTSTSETQRVDDLRLPPLAARLGRQSARVYVLLDRPEEAQRYLSEAHDGWAPQDPSQRAGRDYETAVIQLDLHRLDTAEQFAASAVRTYGQGRRRDRIWAELLLAEIHIRAGEPRGLALAHHAINEVSTLQSVAARQHRLIPLATALEARPGSETQELAQVARKIATTRI